MSLCAIGEASGLRVEGEPCRNIAASARGRFSSAAFSELAALSFLWCSEASAGTESRACA